MDRDEQIEQGCSSRPPGVNSNATAEETTNGYRQEFAFHHEIFNTYIEPPGEGVRVMSNPSMKKLSRRLCFVLRWGAPSLGVSIGEDGYVEAKRLRSVATLATCTDDVIREIVRQDAKRRFSISAAQA